MSDIGASDAGEAISEAPAGDVTEVEFDLDAAIEDFATNAPDEWKGKASKLQSELKGIRSSRNELRDKFSAFDGLHEDDFTAVTSLVTAIKTGNTEGAAQWMVEAAKGLTGDQFEEKFGFTKAEAKEAIEAIDEAPAEEELSVEDRIQKALDERERAHKEAVQAQERQAAINSQFSELGYDVTRNANGTLANFQTQMVAQLAVNDHKGDIKAAHEAFEKLQGDWAKAYLQKHQGDPALSPEGGSGAGTPEKGAAEMTPAQRAQDRIDRLQAGAEA